jgi:hypothetical protein
LNITTASESAVSTAVAFAPGLAVLARTATVLMLELVLLVTGEPPRVACAMQGKVLTSSDKPPSVVCNRL